MDVTVPPQKGRDKVNTLRNVRSLARFIDSQSVGKTAGQARHLISTNAVGVLGCLLE